MLIEALGGKSGELTHVEDVASIRGSTSAYTFPTTGKYVVFSSFAVTSSTSKVQLSQFHTTGGATIDTASANVYGKTVGSNTVSSAVLVVDVASSGSIYCDFTVNLQDTQIFKIG